MFSCLIAFILLTIYYYFKYKEVKMDYKQLTICYFFTFFLLFLFVKVEGFPSLTEFYRLKKQTGHWYHGNSNLIPFTAGLSITDLFNLVAFVPIGIMLPLMWEKYHRLLPTVAYGAALSLLIEFSQLFTFHRVTNTSDLLMNILGTIVGWLFFKKTLKPLFSKNKACEMTGEEGYEEWLLPSIAIISALFA
ncbi:VanZ family protein [Enterococcus faecalis]